MRGKAKLAKKALAAKMVEAERILTALYAEFDAAQVAGNVAEEERLVAELARFAFNPDYEVKR